MKSTPLTAFIIGWFFGAVIATLTALIVGAPLILFLSIFGSTSGFLTVIFVGAAIAGIFSGLGAVILFYIFKFLKPMTRYLLSGILLILGILFFGGVFDAIAFTGFVLTYMGGSRRR